MNYNSDDIFVSLGKLHFEMSQAQRYISLLKEELEEKQKEILRFNINNNTDKKQEPDE